MTNAEMDSQSPFAGILLGQPTLRKRLRLGTMEQGIEELNRYTVGWMAYFALADTPTGAPRSSTGGSGGDYGRCGGRNGSGCAASCAT